MANRLDRQIMSDGWRGGEVRFTGVLDSSDVSLTPALSLSDFTNNDVLQRLVGLRVDKIEFAVGPNLEIILEWNAASPQLLAALTYASKQKYECYGGLLPNQLNPGYDGAINLNTQGFSVGTPAVYTVFMSFVKLYAR